MDDAVADVVNGTEAGGMTWFGSISIGSSFKIVVLKEND